jgi:hypothetical protein
MLSLATLKFEGAWADFPRKFVYGLCYVFMVASSSFHVMSKAWDTAATLPKSETEAVQSLSPATDRALQAMTEALTQATKSRAFNTMGILGTEVSKQISPKSPAPQAQPLGIPRDLVIWVGAVIIIILRTLLEATQAINAIALRNYFTPKAKSSGSAK